MRKFLIGAVMALGLAVSWGASADYIFSGSGVSGTLVSPTETWVVGCTSPCPAGTTGWGSPGVSLSTTTYGEAITATDFLIAFVGTEIDLGQIIVGAAAGCAGTETGGTTFCDASDLEPWTVELIDPKTIRFVAPPGGGLETGESYFVNIFLVGEGIQTVEFKGLWSTERAPEPSSLALLGLALFGVAIARRRRTS